MFKNKDFEIAYNHLDKSIHDSQNATQNILDLINQTLTLLKDSNIDDKITEKLTQNLEKSIESLQFQDIMAQRLTKVKKFLINADKIIDKHSQIVDLNKFAWDKEIEQSDVDDILKSHGL